MKNIKIYLSALALGFFILSCNNSKETPMQTESHQHEDHAHGSEHHDHESEEHSGHDSEHSDHASSEEISLNNGEKWAVNAEMKPFVNESEKMVNDFLSHHQKDYQKLAQEITAKNDQLIKSCTMNGKSHEELHKWLAPHLKLVEQLSKEKDPVQAENIVHELENSYKTYHHYFQ